MSIENVDPTETSLALAQMSLNNAQNQNWNEGQAALARMMMPDLQTRALIAIGQELKRLNDLVQEAVDGKY